MEPEQDRRTGQKGKSQGRRSTDGVDSIRHTLKWFTLGAGLVLLALTVIIAWQYQDGKDRDAEQEVSRVERSVESCFNYNADQTNDRKSLINLIPELGTDFFDMSEAEAAALLTEGQGPKYVAFIEDTNPYRQCSRACVVAQTDPDIANCPPSDSEDGSPPKEK